MVEVGQGLRGAARHTELELQMLSVSVPLTAGGNDSPMRRLPLCDHRGSGWDSPGCVFSAGSAPGHRSPMNPANSAFYQIKIECVCSGEDEREEFTSPGHSMSE